MRARIFALIFFIAAMLFGLAGGLVTLFFRHYRGTLIPHPWLFYLGGIALGIISCILYLNTASLLHDQDHRERQRLIDDLMTNGEKIAVDLSACEVRGNDYTETTEVYHRGAAASEFITENIQRSVFIFHYENLRTGQLEKFISPIIPKDKISLSFHLEAQRQTNLYVDKTDRSRYYFDLDFLAGA